MSRLLTLVVVTVFLVPPVPAGQLFEPPLKVLASEDLWVNIFEEPESLVAELGTTPVGPPKLDGTYWLRLDKETFAVVESRPSAELP